MALQHPISEADIHTYECDVAADDADGGSGRAIVSSHTARTSPRFMDIVANSPAAEIAARLMVVPDVRYLYDQLFIKEPGTTAPTD